MDAKSRHYTHSINSGYELAGNLYGAASNVYDNFPHVTHDLPRIPIPHTPKFPPIPSTNNVAHGDEKGNLLFKSLQSQLVGEFNAAKCWGYPRIFSF